MVKPSIFLLPILSIGINRLRPCIPELGKKRGNTGFVLWVLEDGVKRFFGLHNLRGSVIVDILTQKGGNIGVQQVAIKFSIFPVDSDCFISTEHELVGILPAHLIVKMVNEVLSNTEAFLRGTFNTFREQK